MSDPVLWQCELRDTQNLTVGALFYLHCEGNIPVDFKNSLSLVLPEKTPPFSLVLLGVNKKSSSSFDLKMTSYRGGEFKLPYVRLTDGQVSVDTSKLEWSVKSLLTPQSKPTPPKGPFALEFPASMMIAGAVLAGVILLTAAGLFYRHRKKAALTTALEEHRSHLSPLRQFESSLRGLRRPLTWKNEWEAAEAKVLLEDFSLAFKVYLLRRFQVLPFKLSRRQTAQLIFRNSSVKDRQAWVAFLKELEVALAHPKEVEVQGALQLMETAGRLVADLENQGGKA